MEELHTKNKKLKSPASPAAEKLREAALSVLPIALVVLVLTLFFVPVPTDALLSFLLGASMAAIGMGFFTHGAESSMTVVGARIGASLTRSRNIALILTVSLVLGVAITVAEPDLQVLAETVPHISNIVLILTVGLGVGVFLAVCMLRIILGIPLRWLLLGFYAAVFALAVFSDASFLNVAFDAGGVTTGPMTVPFILALGVGVANIRSDKKAESDSFGLVSLCSIGPILAVLILGFFYKGGGDAVAVTADSWSSSVELGGSYLSALPEYLSETALALAPIAVILLLFQVFSLKMQKRSFAKICVGVLFTYLGLVLFLTGVNVGFSSLGAVLGAALANGWIKYLLIPVAMLLGWFIVSAEPAVYVLEKQIEEVSAGAISGKTIKLGLSAAISIAMGLAMLRVLTGISLLWFLAPGYAIAILLSFFVPDIFTAIAFDSGGVASGPMTATFMLQFSIGASTALGGNVLQDAFGLVALVAMLPPITIQLIGAVSVRKSKRTAVDISGGETEVIELWV